MAKQKKEKQKKQQKKENQSKNYKKNSKKASTQYNNNEETDQKDKKEDQEEKKTLQDYRNEFEKKKQQYQSGSSDDQGGSGDGGLNIKDFTSMLGMLSSNLVPEEYRQQYIKMYVGNTTPFLKMLGVDKFVSQYSFEEIPITYKVMLIALILIVPMGTGIMYFNKNTKDQKKKKEGDQD